MNIGIQGGKIAVVSEGEIPRGERAIDAEGAMVSPPFIDAHFHLENAYLEQTPNLSGTLQEAIGVYAEIKPKLDAADILRRTMRVAREAIANGTLWMRSHVDIDHIGKLRLLESVLAARVIEKVKKAEMTIIGNIPINLYLEGRHDPHPFRRGIPRLRDLVEAGVNVALGQDDVRNMFYPFGKLSYLPRLANG